MFMLPVSMRPPWSSNYTTNINLEENYWPAEVTNLSEMHSPLLSFIDHLSQTGKITAQTFFGCRGWTACHNSDIWAMLFQFQLVRLLVSKSYAPFPFTKFQFQLVRLLAIFPKGLSVATGFQFQLVRLLDEINETSSFSYIISIPVGAIISLFAELCNRFSNISIPVGAIIRNR